MTVLKQSNTDNGMTVLDVYDCFGRVRWFWMCKTVFSINSHLRSERRRTLCFLRSREMFDKKEVTFLVQKFWELSGPTCYDELKPKRNWSKKSWEIFFRQKLILTVYFNSSQPYSVWRTPNPTSKKWPKGASLSIQDLVATAHHPGGFIQNGAEEDEPASGCIFSSHFC